MNQKQQFFSLLFFLVAIAFAGRVNATINLPTDAAYPGGIALIPLSVTGYNTPHVTFRKHRVMVIKNRKKWVAVVGIPLSAKVGKQKIEIKRSFGNNQFQTFSIHYKKYPLRHITIKDKSKVTPNPELARKINQQYRQIRSFLNQWNQWDKKSTPPTSFILPVKGRFSSGFGIRRIYNKTKHSRHTGLDIAAPKGTEIHAAAAGRVIATADYVITGNTVFVNHGQGLITYYCHMNSINVKPGEIVKQGEVLGTVGATGRVTGPHVHWAVSLNNARVNPLLFVQTG